ncbi:MAG: DNA primase, partial [Puniceicoccaceae bacterium]
MARIPEEELERIKREVDLAALVRSRGIELKAHGSKDLAGLSPFSEEKTPSFIVSPGKNLWHCMSSGQGGSVIDFVMKYDGVSFREAVELLRVKSPSLYKSSGPVKKATVPKLPPPVAYDADDQTLFGQVLDYYREQLRATPAALDYLHSRGVTAEAIETFGIGFADRTLGLRLPHKNRRDGQEIRARLQRIGIYRESGHEHFNGCAVFPVRDAEGNVTEIYGRRIGPQKSGIYHLYLPGPHRGLFNERAFQSPEVILTESVIDALTFWVNGLRHATCIWGTEGFTEDLLEAFKKHRTAKVYLAYDNDPAGNRAAERDASRLGSLGIECYRLKWPPGIDANEYALAAARQSRQGGITPAAESLPALLNGAEWLGSGTPQKSEDYRNEIADTYSSLAAKLAADAGSADAPDEPDPAGPVDAQGEAAKGKKGDGMEVGAKGEDWLIRVHDREYRIRGLEKNTSFEVLKVNLRLLYPAPTVNGQPPTANSSDARYYLDTLDFYRAKERERFIAAAAAETTLTPDLVKRDLGKVLLKLEELQEKRIREEMEPKKQAVAIAEEDRAAALELLRSPDLLERIVADFEACGIVGEATNKLTGYLAAVSRKLDKPLAVIIQSTSAAGKTSLMEAVLELMHEEERVKYSAMTVQSLY